jgi:hypothetical protein
MTIPVSSSLCRPDFIDEQPEFAFQRHYCTLLFLPSRSTWLSSTASFQSP